MVLRCWQHFWALRWLACDGEIWWHEAHVCRDIYIVDLRRRMKLNHRLISATTCFFPFSQKDAPHKMKFYHYPNWPHNSLPKNTEDFFKLTGNVLKSQRMHDGGPALLGTRQVRQVMWLAAWGVGAYHQLPARLIMHAAHHLLQCFWACTIM